MIRGQTIVCIASNYDAPPTSKHHVMRVLAADNAVLWVNYHGSRRPGANLSDLGHAAGKVRQVLGGLRPEQPGLWVLTPPVVPLPGAGWARRLNRFLVARSIRRALRRMSGGPVQLWSFAPDIAYLLGRLGERKVVYYCVDDFASFSGYDRSQVLRDEEELCRRSDLVVTTSQALQIAKAALNSNTILVRHGVDYAHFARAVSEDLPSPRELAAIPHPRIGFVGLLRDWVDLGLVAAVAKANPQWHFVFIGDRAGAVNAEELPNMHFVGGRPYAQLPAWCRHFDVGIIPFVVNDLTRAVNPIKFREYLAAGLPVVSTPLPEVQGDARDVRIADGPEDFAAAIASILAERRSRADRSRTMAAETWASKVQQVVVALGEE
jgi:glycosyltransferase involved in cell wall biosynthesis